MDGETVSLVSVLMLSSNSFTGLQVTAFSGGSRGGVSSGLKRPEREADHSTKSPAEFDNAWR